MSTEGYFAAQDSIHVKFCSETYIALVRRQFENIKFSNLTVLHLTDLIYMLVKVK